MPQATLRLYGFLDWQESALPGLYITTVHTGSAPWQLVFHRILALSLKQNLIQLNHFCINNWGK